MKPCEGIAGVVQIKAVALYRGIMVVYMDLAVNGSLAQILDIIRFERPNEWTCRKWCLQLLELLELLNRKGVMHRDVKPDNLLLDGEGELILADFNLTVIGLGEDGVTDGRAGTDFYIAPEVQDGHYYDYRCDVYSVGRTLLALALGVECLKAWDNVADRRKAAIGMGTILKEHGWSKGGVLVMLRLVLENPEQRPTTEYSRQTWVLP